MLQGEREFARDNKLLGTFTLRGIKRAWAGVPKIEVTFDIDANGIVKVKARDMDTGKQQSITISGTSNLTEDEIKRAKENAAAFAGQDKERKAALEALNAGEAALYRVNTALGSKAGKALDRETRTKIKEAERTLERVLKHKKVDKLTPVDVNAINTAREALSAVAARWWPGGRARRRKTRRQPQGPRSGASIRPCPFAVLLNNAFSPLARGNFFVLYYPT